MSSRLAWSRDASGVGGVFHEISSAGGAFVGPDHLGLDIAPNFRRRPAQISSTDSDFGQLGGVESNVLGGGILVRWDCCSGWSSFSSSSRQSQV